MRKIKVFITLMMVVLLMLTISSCGQESEKYIDSKQEFSSEDLEKMVMPESLGTTEDLNKFATIDIYGNPVSNEVFADYDYTIIDVWGTYCNPCIKAMPDMKKVYDEYKEKGINVMGIVVDVQNADRTPQMDSIGTARAIVEKQEADFTHILIPENLLYSLLSDIRVIPTQFLVDNEGNIVTEFFEGGKNFEKWSELLDKKIDAKKLAEELEK